MKIQIKLTFKLDEQVFTQYIRKILYTKLNYLYFGQIIYKIRLLIWINILYSIYIDVPTAQSKQWRVMYLCSWITIICALNFKGYIYDLYCYLHLSVLESDVKWGRWRKRIKIKKWILKMLLLFLFVNALSADLSLVAYYNELGKTKNTEQFWGFFFTKHDQGSTRIFKS